jgi:pimeloyl-ACP methyl ester carboxylesterase
LALYEAPFLVDGDGPARPEDLVQRFETMVEAGDRGGAVRLFMRTVGVPGFVIRLMRFMPAWPKLTAVAHTLPYDFQTLGDTGSGKPLPADRWADVTIPTLSMDGGKSPAHMRHAMEAVARVLPSAEHRTLPGQTHMLKASAMAPVLAEFFAE